MKTVDELRRRISNVEDVQSIVSTMKTLAAVQIRQFEAATDAMAEYDRTVQFGFHILFRDHPIRSSNQNPHEDSGAIVLGSDQGLCGQFNEDIVRYALSDRRHRPETSWRTMVIGSRAMRQFDDANQSVETHFGVPTTVAEITRLLQDVMPYIDSWRRDGVGRIVVYFNNRTSVATYCPEQYQLFPLELEYLRRCQAVRWDSRSLPTYAMPWNQVFAAVVRQYLFVGLYRACAESRASENASRIASMQSASKNIERRLSDLNRQFNQTRQAAITEEILDIATGVEALKG